MARKHVQRMEIMKSFSCKIPEMFEMLESSTKLIFDNESYNLVVGLIIHFQ